MSNVVDRIRKVNEIIKSTETSFSNALAEYTTRLHELFPKKNALSKVKENLPEFKVDAIAAWYVETLSPYSGKVLDLPSGNRHIEDFYAKGIYLLPGVDSCGLIKDWTCVTSEPESKSAQRALRCIDITRELLPSLYIRAEMITEIRSCKKGDLAQLTAIINKYYKMLDSLKASRVAKPQQVLSVSNIFENCMNIQQAGGPLLANNGGGAAINPMGLTMVKLMIQRSGYGDRFLNIDKFNEMLDDITPDKLSSAANVVKEFMQTVGRDEAGNVAEEVMRIVMGTLRDQNRAQDPINRVIKTFQTVAEQLKANERYRDFNIKDVFMAIMVYVKTLPEVRDSQQLSGVIDKLGNVVDKIGAKHDASPDSKFELGDVKADMMDLVKSALSATGNAGVASTGLVDTVFGGIERFSNGEMGLGEIQNIAKTVGLDGVLDEAQIGQIVAAVGENATSSSSAQPVKLGANPAAPQ
jgi:hypothetical protein